MNVTQLKSEQQGFYQRLMCLASLVPGFQLSQSLIALYDSSLKSMGYARLCFAIDEIIQNRSSRDPFPSLKEIRGRANPQLSHEDQAALIASQIIGAIRSIGPYRLSDAKEKLGSLAWQVVQSEGGWENLCTSLDDENLPTLRAQWRNLAKALLTQKQGMDQELLCDSTQKKNQQGASLVSLQSIFLDLKKHEQTMGGEM